ncbi:MAG: HGGxSTG domain-containing protein [Paracoccaceae bacterium]
MMPTGADLRAARKAKGLNQTELGRLSGHSRNTVSYWENKPRLKRYAACAAMCRALGVHVPSRLERDLYADHQQAALDRQVSAQLEAAREAQQREESTRRVACGAKTRKGRPCRALSEPGRNRCRFHGGKSTGPRTDEGKARIAEAQRKRWAKWRDNQLEQRGTGGSTCPTRLSDSHGSGPQQPEPETFQQKLCRALAASRSD